MSAVTRPDSAAISRRRCANSGLISGATSASVPPPKPNSARPPLSWSMVAIRSAVRTGSLCEACTIPVPIRIRLVLAAIAPSSTSTAELCAYSGMKWCSPRNT